MILSFLTVIAKLYNYISFATINSIVLIKLKNYELLFCIRCNSTTEEWIPAYLPAANQLVAKHGGSYLARTSSHEQVEGNISEAGLRIIIGWPSKESALAFMNDPEYASHLKARTEGSVSNHYLIEAKDDLA